MRLQYYEFVSRFSPSTSFAPALGEQTMTRVPVVRLIILCFLLAMLFAACSRDPNVRKQKYFESGERYFAKGKYREAAIQYSNAVRVDPRFAQAHSQLGETYLKLHDWNRAYTELSLAVEQDPDNHSARVDLI